MRPLPIALALVLLGACTPDFEPVWKVKDLRILAVQAEPPEVIQPLGTLTFPPVHINPLIIDPYAPAGALYDWQLWACSADDARCDKAEFQKLVSSGTSPLSALQFDFVVDAELLAAAIAADPAKGFGGVAVMLDLRVQRDAANYDRAVKRVVYGAPIPAEKQANRNPYLDRVLLDGEDPAQPWPVKTGQKLKLLPNPAKDAAESYWVPTFTGSKKELTEFLSYAFFTTAGELSDATTGGKPTPFVENKKIADPSSEWTAPADPQGVDFWLVVHDDRGGVGWTKLHADVQKQ